MSQALIGHWIEEKNTLTKVTSVIFGVVFLAALAQIAIPLPFTPVPITGQTFGVALLSLLWGRKWGFASVVAYVCVGAAGLPVFAQAASGLKLASSGYLVGMCASALVIGSLADRGYSQSFGKSLLACFLGSLCVFSFGLLVLSQFVPAKMLLAQGLIPFIPGDIIKSTLASLIASRSARRGGTTL